MRWVPGMLCTIRPNNIAQGVLLEGRTSLGVTEHLVVVGPEEHVIVVTTVDDMINSRGITQKLAFHKGLLSNDVLVLGSIGMFWMEDYCLIPVE